MKPILSLAPALAVSMLTAHPCSAAEDIRDRAAPHYRPAPYAGATFRLSFAGQEEVRSDLRLQAGIARTPEGRGAIGSPHALQVTAFEVGGSPEGKPVFYLAGQEARDLGQRLGVRGSTGKTLLIVGGVLVVVVVVGLMTSGGTLGPCTSPGC